MPTALCGVYPLVLAYVSGADRCGSHRQYGGIRSMYDIPIDMSLIKVLDG